MGWGQEGGLETLSKNVYYITKIPKIYKVVGIK